MSFNGNQEFEENLSFISINHKGLVNGRSFLAGFLWEEALWVPPDSWIKMIGSASGWNERHEKFSVGDKWKAYEYLASSSIE